MFRLALLLNILLFTVLGCIESPPPASLVSTDMDMGTDQTSDVVESCDCGDGLFCDVNGGCVQCLNSDHCDGQVCSPAGTCVECLEDDTSKCPAAESFCNGNNTCVSCRTSDDCDGALECEGFVCVGCQDDEECGGLRCHTETATCVACLGDGEDSCPHDSPVCASESKSCVVCTEEEGCANGQKCKITGQEQNRCVQCLENTDCADGQVCSESNICVLCDEQNPCQRGVCKIDLNDPTTNSCVECLESSMCGATAPTCTNNECGSCSEVVECAHLGDSYRYCFNGGCRECFNFNEAADCGSRFCNSSTGMCSTVTAGNVRPLEACALSSDCTLESRCVPLTHKGNPLGTYCMPLISTDQNVFCPAPYGAQKSPRQTIEGEPVTVCMIDEQRTTPAAIAEAGNVCGLNLMQCVAPASECKLRDTLNSVCTYSCEDNFDCTAGRECRCAGGNLSMCSSSTPKFCLAPLTP